MPTIYQHILAEEKEGLLTVSINRPDRRNAVHGPCARELFEVFSYFSDNPDLQVAVLTGVGSTFCAGADLKSVASGEQANPIETEGDLGPMGPTRLETGKPVIAAIEGHAVAGGLELALWCDLRVVADDATLGVYCRRFGVPLVDGGTVRLPRLIGQSRAMDLILTGRAVGTEEALAMGLANRNAPPGQALKVAQTLARELMQFPQQCMRNDRLAAIEQWSLPREEALKNEFKRGLDTLQSGETVQGAKAFSTGKGRHGQF